MDFLTNFFTLPMLVYAILGIPALLGFVILVRLSRQGRTNFVERHKAMDLRIQQTACETEELNKTILRTEQLHIVATALREAVSLQRQRMDCPLIPFSVEEQDNAVFFHLEKHTLIIQYKEKKQFLHSTGKTVYGQGYFEVFGPFFKEHSYGNMREEENKNLSSCFPPKGDGKIFYSLLELEQYLTKNMQSRTNHLLPPTLRIHK